MPIIITKIQISQSFEPDIHVRDLKQLEKFRSDLIKQVRIGDSEDVQVLFTIRTEDFDSVKYPPKHKTV